MQERVQNIYNIPLDIIGMKDRVSENFHHLFLFEVVDHLTGVKTTTAYTKSRKSRTLKIHRTFQIVNKQQKMNEGER